MNRLSVKDMLACLAILVVLTGLGFYAMALNEAFYRTHGPFWDSVSYDDLMARVMLAVRGGDLETAFALFYTSTVALPWLEAMLVAPFVDPSRAVGIWIQAVWMMAAALAAFSYLRRVIGYQTVTAACSALLFFMISGTFSYSGGLSDFRLDALQYTLFGLACLSYLSAVDHPGLGRWTIWGITLGLACLGRATTPVYAALVFGPCFLLDLRRHSATPGTVVRRYFNGIGWCFLVCGWFLITNASHLYFYYAIWSWDATAQLPLAASFQHLVFVFDKIGPVGATALLALFAVNLIARRAADKAGAWNWRALWCGVAPIAFLILSGAGLNPYVAQVGAFGIILFMIAPAPSGPIMPLGRLRQFVALGALAAMIISGVVQGWQEHADKNDRIVAANIPRRDDLTRAMECLTVDAAAQAVASPLTYAILYSGMLNSEVLTNELLFDQQRTARLLPNGFPDIRVGKAELTPVPFRVDHIVTSVQWDMVEGADTAEKVDNLAREIARQADYLFVPSTDSELPGGTVNQHAGAIVERVLTLTPLNPVCRHLPIGPHEFATLYRNEARRPFS